MRLADFIISKEEAILQEWDSFARTMAPAALSMSAKELRNHAAVMLRGIADDLRIPQTSAQELAKSHGQEPDSAQTRAGQQHGIARQESHFSIEQLVAEYRALRASVLRLWARRHSPTPRTSPTSPALAKRSTSCWPLRYSASRRRPAMPWTPKSGARTSSWPWPTSCATCCRRSAPPPAS